jgi:drug/metabolite transporter (DMT)-like permease
MSPGRRSMLLMLAFVALWAAIEALAAQVLTRMSPYQVVWTRYAVHILFMLLIWGWREPAKLWRTRRPVFQLTRSLLMLGMPASWVIAKQFGVPVGTLMSIFWLSPLFIMGFAWMALGERANLSVWLACAAGCAGALVVFRPAPVSLELCIYPLAMALTFSLYVVMTRSLRSETTRANLFYTAIGVLVALSLVMPSLWVTPTARDLWALTGVGVLGFAALLALDRMAAAAPVSVSAPIACLHLLFAAGISWVWHQDRPGIGVTLALLLMVGAGIFMWVREPGLMAKNDRGGDVPDPAVNVPVAQSAAHSARLF